MKTVEEIALEVARDYLKFKLGDRKGFNVYDIDASNADELITEIEQECAKSFMDFLAAVDAERGKDAVSYDEIFNAIAEAASPCGEGIGVSVMAFKRAIGGEIFLSPTIPPGFALVPITGELEGFIVLAVWNYEGSGPVRAFESEADAESFRTKCSNYHATRKPSPELDESEESLDLLDAWSAEDLAWRESHPAGESNAYADSFEICTIMIQAAGVTK